MIEQTVKQQLDDHAKSMRRQLNEGAIQRKDSHQEMVDQAARFYADRMQGKKFKVKRAMP